jgi:hypothetical protein
LLDSGDGAARAASIARRRGDVPLKLRNFWHGEPDIEALAGASLAHDRKRANP